uniref:J domain-containing protein n=1 Tax=viral metagenome TaxID=1070528 RepID=A0A6C0I9X5_9ZZZZ
MGSDNLYELLGVSKGADSAEISKAYKKMAVKHHPDKGGNEETFKKIQRAYDVLGDDKSREFYNMTGQIPGENGAPQPGEGHGGMPFGMGGGMPFNMGGGGMPFGMNMADLFGMFGGRGGGGNGGMPRKHPGKAPPRVEHLPVSLAQLYNGGSFVICLNREKFCGGCNGVGSKVLKTCDRCRGAGKVVQDVMIGPGMAMRTEGPCGDCAGKGEKKGEPCKDCEGQGLKRQIKNLTVNITPGMAVGDNIVFDGESSDTHEYERAADLQIVLDAADDDHGWVRDGNNLRRDIHVSLAESLCGTNVHLLGHPSQVGGINIDVPRGVHHTQEIVVIGRGMPFKGRPGFGNLILKVHVVTQDAEQRVLDEKGSQLNELFGYVKKSPVGDGAIWTARSVT